jgi:hypothetical protein
VDDDGDVEEKSKSMASLSSVGVDAVLCSRSSVTKMCFECVWRCADDDGCCDDSGDRIEDGDVNEDDERRDAAAAVEPDESGRDGGEASDGCWWC